MVCSIDDIVSRRPGKHTRFPTVYTHVVLRSYLLYFLTVVRVSLSTFFFFIYLSLSIYLSTYLSFCIFQYRRKLFARAWAFNCKSLFSVSNLSLDLVCASFCFIFTFYAS